MRKSDLITLNEQISIKFSHMGLFDTTAPWLHPTVTIDTYELIYVVEGKINLREGEREYRLKKGDMILLTPDVEHGGCEESHGHTSFYWLHFSAEHLDALAPPKVSTPNALDANSFFRETMHCSTAQPLACELRIASFLLALSQPQEVGNKLAYELDEFIRINVKRNLTVANLAEQFGYSADYLSRIYKKQFRIDLCKGIARHRLALAQSLLLNTNGTVKEIAQTCGFDDENTFVKFFKYHTKTTPTAFRNRYFYIHMNND